MSLERDDCPPCALPKPLLASLMRAVAKTSAWATYRDRLIRRMPDDVWEDRPNEWIITFQHEPAPGIDEELLMFDVLRDDQSNNPVVRSATFLSRRLEDVDSRSVSVEARQ